MCVCFASTFHSSASASAGCTFVINFVGRVQKKPEPKNQFCTYEKETFQSDRKNTTHGPCSHTIWALWKTKCDHETHAHCSCCTRNRVCKDVEVGKKRNHRRSCFCDDANLIHKINFFNKIISASI